MNQMKRALARSTLLCLSFSTFVATSPAGALPIALESLPWAVVGAALRLQLGLWVGRRAAHPTAARLARRVVRDGLGRRRAGGGRHRRAPRARRRRRRLGLRERRRSRRREGGARLRVAARTMDDRDAGAPARRRDD